MKKTVLLYMMFLFSLHVDAQFALVQQLSAQINQDSLITYVKQLSGILPVQTPEGEKIITSRLKGSPGNELTAQYIKQKLTSWGIAYETKDFSLTGQNITGKIEGRRPGKIMVTGAHYDAVGTGNLEIVYPGADDNASGTAAVLEIARVCSQQQFPVTLHFAFWDEEEQGLVGSQASAPDYLQYKLVGYINMDMIAYDSNNDSSFDIHCRPAGFSVSMAQRAFDLVNLYSVPLKPRIVNPGDPNTDHGSFWQNNLSAIGVNEEYEGDFTPHWHKITDSITHFNISYFTRMSRFAGTAFMHFAMDSNNLVGTNDVEDLNDLVAVYPNPFRDKIKISKSESVTIIKAELSDMAGNVVSAIDINDNSLTINETIAEGLYYLRLYAKNGYVFRKLMLKL